MKFLGKHLLAELYGCSPQKLKNADILKEILLRAAKICQAKILAHSFYEFKKPAGVSGVVIIAESHISIHSWPKQRFAAVDIFTCAKSMKPEKALAYIMEALECRKFGHEIVGRGDKREIKSKRKGAKRHE